MAHISGLDSATQPHHTLSEFRLKPIYFSCRADSPIPPGETADQILDTTSWSTFQGYWPLPGIEFATFEHKTPEIVGSRIAVKNTDGSRHIETITEWFPDRRIALKLNGFSPPLSLLAHSIEEQWEFEQAEGKTEIIRSFRLHPRSSFTRPIVWLISQLLKRAVNRHLQQILVRSASNAEAD